MILSFEVVYQKKYKWLVIWWIDEKRTKLIIFKLSDISWFFSKANGSLLCGTKNEYPEIFTLDSLCTLKTKNIHTEVEDWKIEGPKDQLEEHWGT